VVRQVPFGSLLANLTVRPQYEMENYTMKELADKLNQNWQTIFITTMLVLGMLLLFFDKLPEHVKMTLIEPLVIYALGSALIGNIQGSFFRARGLESGYREPVLLFTLMHTAWFMIFVGIVVYR
jgi:hypothetical protein